MKSWEIILASALRCQWKQYKKALNRCQRRFSEKAVHESRVESRRLLAQLELLGIFAPARLFAQARRALKRHLDIFDPLRDTQVQLRLLDEQGNAFPETEKFRAALRTREKRCLRQAARRICKLKIGPVKRIIDVLIDQLQAVRRHPARRQRERRAIMKSVNLAFIRVSERRRLMNEREVETIHRTRVAFKKFRYMIEALQPLFREITKGRLRAMHAFQSLLGELQDTDMFEARLDKFIGKHDKRRRHLARFRRWLKGRRAQQIRNCLEHADEIFSFWPLRPTNRRSPKSR